MVIYIVTRSADYETEVVKAFKSFVDAVRWVEAQEDQRHKPEFSHAPFYQIKDMELE